MTVTEREEKAKVCRTCEWFDYFKGRDIKPLRAKYSMALVENLYKGIVFSGQSTHYGIPLNYCPTCGKKVKM